MKYKIIKTQEYSKKLNPETKLYELEITDLYGAKRKGTILGFWHDVGEELCDSQGNLFTCEEWCSSIDQCISYIKCYHHEHYGKDEPLEILDYEEK